MAGLGGGRGHLIAFVLLVVLAVALGNLIYALQFLPPPEQGGGPTTGGRPGNVTAPGPIIDAEGAGAIVRIVWIAMMVASTIFVVGYFIILWRRRRTFKGPLSPPAFNSSNFLMAIAMALVALILLVVVRGRGGLNLGGGVGSGAGGTQPPSAGLQLPIGGAPFTIPLGLIILLVALAILIGLNYIRRGRRAPARPVEGTRRRVAAEVRRALYSIETGDDPRTAILRCYHNTCQILDRHGVADSEAITPREFEDRARPALGLSVNNLHSLTSLFELARYSHHPVGPADRDTAVGCLKAIEGELGA